MTNTDKEQGRGLLPCPFCGAEAARIGPYGGEGLFGVQCLQCDGSVRGYDSCAHAVDAWNTLTPPPDTLGQGAMTVSDEDWQRAIDCAMSCLKKPFHISRSSMDNAMQHAFGMLSLVATRSPVESETDAALRDAFPHFQDGAPITAEAIKGIGKEYLEMVMGWAPVPREIKFMDADGGEYALRDEDGWYLDGVVAPKTGLASALLRASRPRESVPAQGATQGVAAQRATRAEDIAIALCLVDGRDPDDEAPLTEMCDEANMPVPWWMTYVEYAEALLEKFDIRALASPPREDK